MSTHSNASSEAFVQPPPAAGSASGLLPALAVPTAPTKRVLATDVLRGIAILGILPMNMQLFALYPVTAIYPYAGEFTDPINIAVWTLLRVFIGSKDLILFSMLFGAGMIMAEGSRRAPGNTGSALHYRRMAVLLAFGLVHAYLIWSGDILVTYALCGSLVYLFRKLRPSTLALLGILAFAVPMGLLAMAHFVVPRLSPHTQNALISGLRPDAETIAHFNQVYSGSWLAQMENRIPDAIANETISVLLFMGWIAAGMMLLGMAMQKHGVLTAKSSTRSYVMMIGAALFVGFPLLIYSFVWSFARQWRLPDGFLLGWCFRETSYVIIAFGWIGAVMLICRHGKLPRLSVVLGAVGQMALTNYLMQSVICSLIFYGHGLGLGGKVDHLGQILITLLIWSAQLVLSPIWLARFRFGPAEWLWRSLAYGRWQLMRYGTSRV
jgi:uncharacterized protein